jgi:hypothetical protein
MSKRNATASAVTPDPADRCLASGTRSGHFRLSELLSGWTLMVLVAVLTGIGCTRSGDCVVGTAYCDCTGAQACDPGLTCVAESAGGAGMCQPGSGTGGGPGSLGSTPAQTNHRDAFVGLYSGGIVSDSGLFNSFFLFNADGRLYQGKPLWRADGTFDLDASVAANPDSGATYRVENDRMLVVFTTAEGRRRHPEGLDLPVSRNPKGDLRFLYAGESFNPVYPSPWKQLDGRFQSRTSNSLGPTSPGTGAYGTMHVTVSTSASFWFEFTADGKFKYDEQAIAVSTTSVVGSQGPSMVVNPTTTESRAEGTYRIDGSLLSLVFANGTSAQDIFVLYGGENPNEKGFYLGSNFYFKR